MLCTRQRVRCSQTTRPTGVRTLVCSPQRANYSLGSRRAETGSEIENRLKRGIENIQERSLSLQDPVIKTRFAAGYSTLTDKVTIITGDPSLTSLLFRNAFSPFFESVHLGEYCKDRAPDLDEACEVFVVLLLIGGFVVGTYGAGALEIITKDDSQRLGILHTRIRITPQADAQARGECGKYARTGCLGSILRTRVRSLAEATQEAGLPYRVNTSCETAVWMLKSEETYIFWHL